VETNRIDVQVTVVDNEPVCSPDVAVVRGRDAMLTFQLQTPGYVFRPSDAVVVTNPGTQFPHPSRTLPPDDTTVTLLDLGTERGTFDYTVWVQPVQGGKPLSLDPTIQNEL